LSLSRWIMQRSNLIIKKSFEGRDQVFIPQVSYYEFDDLIEQTEQLGFKVKMYHKEKCEGYDGVMYGILFERVKKNG